MFNLPDLPYAYNALEPFIDEQTMHLHHEKHHAAYVKNLNEALAGMDEFLNMDIDELMKNLDKIPENIRVKVRNNGGGHSNHSLFWQVMAPGKGGEPSGKLLEAVVKEFGGFGEFRELFTKTALGRFGSGWVWLVVTDGKLEIVDTQNQDSPLMQGKVPILGLDVWEHAYYFKYQNRRAEYIDAWWKIVNYEEVERRFELKTL